jgi:hypothetical protein
VFSSLLLGFVFWIAWLYLFGNREIKSFLNLARQFPLMKENHKPRRRWYRFSLRTMLVLITLVCIYLGWALNWKRQREAFLGHQSIGSFPLGYNLAPIWIRIVGARGYGYLDLIDPTDQQVEEAERLFPESAILYTQGGYVRLYKAD